MTRTRGDRAKIRAYTIVYDVRAFWHRLGWAGQILVCSALYAAVILLWFPWFGDLVERAVWGEIL